MESIGNTEEVKGKNNSKGKIVLLVVGIILILSIVLMISRNVYTKSVVKDQLALGQQYLDEMKYEEAIAAFETVLQIDSKNIPGLENISQAYVGKAETDSENAYADMFLIYEKAVEYAEHAYDYYPDDEEVIANLFSVYMSTADYCVKNQDYEKAEEYYEKILQMETSGKDNLNVHKETEIKNREAKEAKEEMRRRVSYGKIAEKLQEDYNQGKLELVINDLLSIEYNEFLEIKNFNPYLYYGSMDSKGNQNGFGISFNYFGCYIGEWKNGIPNGKGAIFDRISSFQPEIRNNMYNLFNGTWKDGLPNGYGEHRTNLVGFSTPGEEISTGMLKAGFWDGEVFKEERIANGWYSEEYGKANNGIWEIIETEVLGGQEYYVYCKGKYWVSVSSSPSISTSATSEKNKSAFMWDSFCTTDKKTILDIWQHKIFWETTSPE